MAKKTEPISPIVQEGNPVLRTNAEPVLLSDIGTKKLNDILVQMAAALEAEHDGVAIAAPQIGVALRIFIVSWRAFTIEEEQKSKTRVKPDDRSTPKKDMIVINPEITKISKKKIQVPEGCLSVRWRYGKTIRNEKTTIRAYDEHGKHFTYGGSGLLAQIFQHEIDHLNGILFIDHATELETLSEEEIAKVQTEAKKNRTS